MSIHSPFLSLEPYWEIPFHHLLVRTAAKVPERTAISPADGQRFSYQRLFQAACSLAYRGYQIAPAEIEAVLLEHPAVLDVTVVPMPNAETGEAPKAFDAGLGRGQALRISRSMSRSAWLRTKRCGK